MINDIIAVVIVIGVMIGLVFGIIFLIRNIVIYFRIKGNISDEDAVKYNLPFSKHFKIKLNNKR